MPYLPLIGTILAAILLILGVIHLLKGCSAQPLSNTEAPTMSLTQTLAESSFTTYSTTNRAGSLNVRANTKLNHDALVSELASQYTDAWTRTGLDEIQSLTGLRLTSHHEQAISFVLGLNQPHKTITYSGTTTKGEVPKIYQWDERWGYFEYCNMPLGFSGCGVTIMAMARMGLTGKTDMGPAEMAQLAVDTGEAEGGTLSSFYINSDVSEATGVYGERLSSTSASLLVQNISKSSYVAINVRANTLASGGHYILAVGVNDDGTIEIRDPNSPTNTAKSWDAEEIASYATAYTVLRAL